MFVSESVRVLLVDDEESYVETLRKRLMRRGLVVSMANSGEQAAFDYLMKPAEMDDLYYKIQDAHKKILLADNG